MNFPTRFTVTNTTILALAYAVWLTSYALLIFFLPTDILAAGLGLCLGLSINLLHILIRPQDLPTSKRAWFYIGMFGMMIFLSQLFGNFSKADMTSVIQSGAMIVIMFIAACIASSDLYQRLLRFYAVIIALAMIMVIADGDYVWGQLVGRAQPNFWGMMALSCAIAALTWNSKAVKLFCLAVVAAMLYLTNSRGSTLSAVAALVTIAGVFYIVHRTRSRVMLLGLLLGIGAVAIWAEMSYSFISESILHLDDPRRGVSSGLTGRLGPWLYGLNLALDRPFFGYGFRASEYLFDPIGINSVHNGYLSMLLDMGILGLLLWIAFLVHVSWTAFRRMHDPGVMYAIGFVVGYSVLGFVERYALNAGQPLSILFLISAFYIFSLRRRGTHGSVRSLRLTKSPAVLHT